MKKVMIAIALGTLAIGAATYACDCGCTAKKNATKKVETKKACPENCKKDCCKKVEAKWLTDFEAAKKEAKSSKKPILIAFAGSDWCPPCIQLEKTVYHQKEFKEYAAENLVLVMADFPRAKKQSAEQKKHNQELQAKYKIRGYPTVILTDSEGKEISRTGYRPGGAKKYVEHLKELLKKK